MATATPSKFNSKSPTIRRIRTPAPLPFHLTPTTATNSLVPPHSPRSPRTNHHPLAGLPRGPARNRPLRMALHAPRPAQIPLRGRHLPRPHRAAADLPLAPPVLPLHHPVRPLRDQPGDLPQHLGTSRGDVAAGVGDPDRAGRAEDVHGDGCQGAVGRVGDG
jgi:hypothetical protein